MMIKTLALLACVAAAYPALQPKQAVESTLTAMADGRLAGESLVAYLRQSGLDVRPLLDGGLPSYPRVLGPQIARHAMRARLSAMPECAEKEYMIRSMMARVWIDLGGEPGGLPVVEPLVGYSDAAFAAQVKPWIDNGAQSALQKISEQSGLPMLADLKGIGATAVSAAESDFVSFLAEERDWRLSRPR